MNTVWLFLSSAILDAGVRSFFLLILVLASLLLLRRFAATTRHLVLLLTFGSLLAMPVLSRVLPRINIVPRAILGTTLPSPKSGSPRPVATPNLPSEGAVPLPPPSPVNSPSALPEDLSPRVNKAPFPLHQWVVIIWAAGASVALLPLTLGCVSLRRLSRGASKVNKPETLALLEQLKDELGIKKKIILLEHPSRRIPMTWGLSPTILLPFGTEAWPLQHLRQVLLHELAHVQRLDFQTRLFGHFIRAVYWFNPLVWLALARLIVEQENASDDLVLQKGANPVDYAQSIFLLVSTSSSSRVESMAAVGMARISQIEERLQLILDPERNRQPLRGTVVGVVSLIFLGVLLPFGLADTKGPAPKLVPVEMTPPQTPADHSRSFNAEGTISYINFNEGKSNLVSTFKYAIYVADSTYSLVLTPASKSVFDGRRIVYDGTNLYCLESYESSMPERRLKNPRLGTNSNIASGYISQGPILHHGVFHDTGPLWLALASASYFQRRTNDIVESVLSFDFAGVVTPSTLRMQKANWICQDDFPRLPKKVVYFDSGRMPNGKPNLLAPYQVGYTSAVYEVKEFTKLSDCIFPGRSTLEVYFPKQKGEVNTDLRLAALYEVTVSKVVLNTTRTIAPPAMPGTTYVMDGRFHSVVGNLTYPSATSWISSEEVKSSSLYSNALRIPRAAPKTPPAVR
jgi:beta-lactamase regulating signal transducer with metallopeptidase domain